MKTKESVAVRTSGKIVGYVNIPVYETVDELLENESPENILSCFNNGNSIKIAGNERSKHQVKKLTKKEQLNIGFTLLTEEERQTFGMDLPAIMKYCYTDEDMKQRIQTEHDRQVAALGETETD